MYRQPLDLRTLAADPIASARARPPFLFQVGSFVYANRQEYAGRINCIVVETQGSRYAISASWSKGTSQKRR